MYRLCRAGAEPAITAEPAPLGPQNQIDPSQANVTRIDGLAATFNPEIHLHSGRDPRLYFRIEMSSFKRKTGVEIEEGGFYRLGGRIGELGNFQKTLRSMASRQDIPFYVPPRMQSALKVGVEYEVTIDWIETLRRPLDWHQEEVDVSSWTWREIGSWVDTEGTLGSIGNRGGRHYLAIGQKDEKAIRQVSAFLESEGIKPFMRLDKHTGVYYAIVNRADHIAIIIKNIEPFIRTENKKMEIADFKRHIARPRKKLRYSIIEARRILGIEER